MRAVRLCIKVGWPVWRLVGDNESARSQVLAMRAGLKRQNRHLHGLFHLLQRMESFVYLEYVPGDLNPADCLSRIDFDWGGSIAIAWREAQVRYKALEAYLDEPSPVWVLVFPKGVVGQPPIWRALPEALRNHCAANSFMRMMSELMFSLESGFLGLRVVQGLSARLEGLFWESGKNNSAGDRNMPGYSCFAL